MGQGRLCLEKGTLQGRTAVPCWCGDTSHKTYQINPRNGCLLRGGKTRGSKHWESSQRLHRLGQDCLLLVLPGPVVPALQGHSVCMTLCDFLHLISMQWISSEIHNSVTKDRSSLPPSHGNPSRWKQTIILFRNILLGKVKFSLKYSTQAYMSSVSFHSLNAI